jgi:hypothetical protein
MNTAAGNNMQVDDIVLCSCRITACGTFEAILKVLDNDMTLSAKLLREKITSCNQLIENKSILELILIFNNIEHYVIAHTFSKEVRAQLKELCSAAIERIYMINNINNMPIIREMQKKIDTLTEEVNELKTLLYIQD